MPRDHSNSAKQTGHEDRVNGKPFEHNPFMTQDNRQQWEVGWRFADNYVQANAQRAETERQTRLRKQPFQTASQPDKVRKPRERHPHGGDW